MDDVEEALDNFPSDDRTRTDGEAVVNELILEQQRGPIGGHRGIEEICQYRKINEN